MAHAVGPDRAGRRRCRASTGGARSTRPAAVGDEPDGGAPVVGHRLPGRQHDLAHDRVGDQREELVLRADVVVEGHGGGVELGRQAAHRQRRRCPRRRRCARGGGDVVAGEAGPAGGGLGSRPHVERARAGTQSSVEPVGAARAALAESRSLLGLGLGPTSRLSFCVELLGRLLDDQVPEGIGWRAGHGVDRFFACHVVQCTANRWPYYVRN